MWQTVLENESLFLQINMKFICPPRWAHIRVCRRVHIGVYCCVFLTTNSLFQPSRVAYHHQLLCLCWPDMCPSTALSRKAVIKLPVVTRPSALFRSSSVSGLPESHYSKLVILAPCQFCRAPPSLPPPLSQSLWSVPSSHKAGNALLWIWLKTVRSWIRYT